MSILIKGMEMPKENAICVVIFPDGEVTSQFGVPHLGTAVPVPPHGRLIDADGEIGVSVIMKPEGKCSVNLIAPTIIPAEPVKKDIYE